MFNKISITLRDTTLAAVDARGGERSTTINRDLARYYAACEASLRRLREKLSDAEAGLILDALNGVGFYDTLSVGFVHAEIADSLADRLSAKWNVDGPALLAKLQALSYADNAALVDAVERWWRRVAAGEQPAHGELFKSP